jgi:hypothetical protein
VHSACRKHHYYTRRPPLRLVRVHAAALHAGAALCFAMPCAPPNRLGNHRALSDVGADEKVYIIFAGRAVGIYDNWCAGSSAIAAPCYARIYLLRSHTTGLELLSKC